VEINNKTGWSGMLGCIDYMHWRWKNINYPTARKLYSRHVEDEPTMILEGVALKDLWI
jgi:hypothetical protein